MTSEGTTDTPTAELPSTLPDGTLKFRIQRADGSDTGHTADVMMLQLASERCQAKHDLAEKDGFLTPTPEFIADLALEFASLGIEGCTPTVAHLIWVTVWQEFEKLKKNIDKTQS